MFSRNGSTYQQRGRSVVPPDLVGSNTAFGAGVALSAYGTTAVVTAPADNTARGAAWTYAIPEAATPPGAPTAVAATPGDGQATVSFAPPASEGGAAVGTYTVTASPGGQSASGDASPVTVFGLENGTSYTFTVTATNEFGTGPASSSTEPVVPEGDPRPHPEPPPAAAAAGDARAARCALTTRPPPPHHSTPTRAQPSGTATGCGGAGNAAQPCARACSGRSRDARVGDREDAAADHERAADRGVHWSPPASCSIRPRSCDPVRAADAEARAPLIERDDEEARLRPEEERVVVGLGLRPALAERRAAGGASGAEVGDVEERDLRAERGGPRSSTSWPMPSSRSSPIGCR